MEIINQNKTNRFTLMFSLYITVNGHYNFTKDLRMLADHNGVNARDFKSAFTYLIEEALIESRESENNEYFACLTHKGIKAVENVFIDVTQSTQYFPAYKEMQG